MSNEQELPESQDETEIQDQDNEKENIEEHEADGEASAEPEQQEISSEEVTAQLQKAEQKAQENWDKYLRLQAEMDNLKRRTQKELENAHKYGLEKFAKELVNVIDSLELGVKASTGDNAEVVKLREGSELTIKQFESVFAKFNIESIDPIGQLFNPELHQAMSMQESVDHQPNSVMMVFQKGYILNGRLLRPAMVVVSKAAAEAAQDTPKIDEQA
jgi:molecular chaperone GrpE